jgi:uncharacterized protein YigE (DUF2233 family)
VARRASRTVAVAVLIAATVVATVALWPRAHDELVGADQGVSYRRVTERGKSYLVADIDLTRATLRQYWRTHDGDRYGNFGSVRSALMAKGEHLTFATNGGIFGPGYVPAGLYVEDGVEREPLNLDDEVGNFYLKPNGVFMVSPGGAAVVSTAAYLATRPTAALALQSGPLLVDGGRVHPAFNRRSENRRVRNAVGVSEPSRVRFVLSEQPVTFFELATLFKDRLGCPDALYLDGEISRFYAPAAEHNDPGGQFAGILTVVPNERPGTRP